MKSFLEDFSNIVIYQKITQYCTQAGRGSSATHHGASGAGHHDDAGAILGHHDDDHSDTMVNHTLFNETTHAPHDLHDLHKVHYHKVYVEKGI